MFRSFALLLLCLLLSDPLLADSGGVELTYRLQPSRDVTMDNTIEGVTTFRVLEDRGVIAKSGGRMSLLPITVTMKRRQSFRYITGDPAEDGSFSVEMLFLDKYTTLQGPDGREQVVPERTALKGVSIRAVIEKDGSVRPASIQLHGVEASRADQLLPVLQSLLAQVAAIPFVVLEPGKTVTQDMQMQIPVPGVASLEIKMKVSNRLLSVDDGKARIQQLYTMDFGTPPAGTKMASDGSGGGLTIYDTRTKTIVSSESTTIMRMKIEAPDGIIEVRMNGKQTQATRATAADSR